MKKFVLKSLLLGSPFLVALILLIGLDVFKVFWSYDDYYKDTYVTLNRGMVCLNTYEKYAAEKQFDSFIFGSSRSHAFTCEAWSQWLPSDAEAFHFDAFDEGIYGLSKKLAYLDNRKVKIRNALIVLDRDVLRKTHEAKGHLFVDPPKLSDYSALSFYANMIKANIDLDFLRAYFDYYFGQTYKPYMMDLIKNSTYPTIANQVNCDFWNQAHAEVEKDSAGYYARMLAKGTFYPRPVKNPKACPVTQSEIQQLKKIKSILDKHGTSYRVVVSPVYDQVPLETDQLELLQSIFGSAYVYDYSGKNELTESYTNFYETSHFRPKVAHWIMEDIYGKPAD